MRWMHTWLTQMIGTVSRRDKARDELNGLIGSFTFDGA